MDLAEILSNNELVHAGFWLSWVCLGVIALLMFYIGEEVSLRNTLLTILMPVDILIGTGCAYVGSGTITSEQAQVICLVIAIAAAAVTVMGIIWRSTTTVGLAAIGLEFTIISLRLFGGYTALIMSAFIVLIAFMHGLKKYRESLARLRQAKRERRSAAARRNHRSRSERIDPEDSYEGGFPGDYAADLSYREGETFVKAGGYRESDYYEADEEQRGTY